MTRDPILFRVDATPQTGFEHLSRCMIYAAALQRRRRPTYFLSRLEPGSMGLNIKRAGHEWLDADGLAGTTEDLEETLQEIRRIRPAAVIVDAADLTEAYLQEIRKTGVLLLCLDHWAHLRSCASILVNPLLAPDKETYSFVPGAQLLLGPRYALIRPEIRRLRPGRAQEPPPLGDDPVRKKGENNGEPAAAKPRMPANQYRVLVALGDDDPENRTEELAKLLLNVPRVGKVDMILRREHPALAQYQSLVEAYPKRLELAVEPSEITARLARCHLAITSGNGWSLELACLGVPQLLLVHNEANWPNAQRMEEEGCATCLGEAATTSAQTIRQAVVNLLSDPLERQAMARCGRKLIDGRGPDRLVTALEVMLHPSREVLTPLAA